MWICKKCECEFETPSEKQVLTMDYSIMTTYPITVNCCPDCNSEEVEELEYGE